MTPDEFDAKIAESERRQKASSARIQTLVDSMHADIANLSGITEHHQERNAAADARLDAIEAHLARNRALLDEQVAQTDELILKSGIQGTRAAQLWDEFQAHRRDGHGGRS